MRSLSKILGIGRPPLFYFFAKLCIPLKLFQLFCQVIFRLLDLTFVISKFIFIENSADINFILIQERLANITFKVLIGNGDITTPEKALQSKQRYLVDGVMIGRGAIGNPCIFAAAKSLLEKNHLPYPTQTLKERLDVCKRHFEMAIENKGEHYGILNMRKHYKNYFRELPNFKETRIKLLTTNSLNEIRELFQSIEKDF